MTYRKRILYFLVKKLHISNQEALELVLKQEVFINKKCASPDDEIDEIDEIKWQDWVLQISKKWIYYAYYKPRFIECTLNSDIENNLKQILNVPEDVVHIGRLDKESEGLLLLTNNGRYIDEILKWEKNIEKEYEVIVNQEITEDFIFQMSNGIQILGKKTHPCKVKEIGKYTFRIILKQGVNRQIRRMCYKLGYDVLRLKRIRIGNITLKNLNPGEKYIFNPQDL